MNTTIRPFHLAFAVDDLVLARRFYSETLGCLEGRSSDHWIDFNLFGHQIVTHLQKCRREAVTNEVDGHEVPVPHFGVVLSMNEFHDLATRLKEKGVKFILEPQIRFEGEVGEQATMFFKDPAGNAIEFKALPDLARLFAK